MSTGSFGSKGLFKIVRHIWPFSSWFMPRPSTGSRPGLPDAGDLVSTVRAAAPDRFELVKGFWNSGGTYIGHRSSDGLFHCDGHQIGYFAEGNEVYGCNGAYLGEVRGLDRLVTNLGKKAWARRTSAPSEVKHTIGQRDVKPVNLLPGYEDFPVSR